MSILTKITPVAEPYACLTWQVNNFCNFQCTYCNPGNWAGDNRNNGSLETYKENTMRIFNTYKDKGYKHFNEVDGKAVPVPHFGVVLEWKVFQDFSQELNDQNIEFQIEPYLRFEGLPGEQLTMFFYDPSGNALEFKSFKHIDQLFSTKI